ncbi:MAG: preprotein translocase subunit SecE [Phycisphaerae bacterium]
MSKTTRRGEGKRPSFESSSKSSGSKPPGSFGGGGGGGGGGSGDRGGFFEVYKPGQGQNTRLWTAVGVGALVCWFAYFLYQKLAIPDFGEYGQVVQVVVAVVVIAAFGLLAYWLLGLNKKVCDFLIATEGEMKKVNWTSRKEIIGSTKVVIFVLASLSILLFVVDIFFMGFFTYIGVLKGASFIDTIKEMF